jgi:hypothetical protein
MIDSNAYYIQIRDMIDKFMEEYGVGNNRLAYLLGMEPHHLNNMKNRNNWNPSITWLERIPPRLERARKFMDEFNAWALANNLPQKLEVRTILRYAMETSTPEFNDIIATVDDAHTNQKNETFRNYAQDKAAASKIQGPGAIVSSNPNTRGILTPDEFVKMMVEDLEKG